MSKQKTTKPAVNAELNIRQKRFARHYAKIGEGKQAAINAGYSPRSAAGISSQMLNHPGIAHEIERFKANEQTRIEIDADKVSFELARIGMSNALDYVDPDTGELVTDLRRLSRDAAAAITDMSVESRPGPDGKPIVKARFKLAPKVPALELLGRQFGMFAKEIRHSGSVAVDMTPQEAERRLIELEAKLVDD